MKLTLPCSIDICALVFMLLLDFNFFWWWTLCHIYLGISEKVPSTMLFIKNNLVRF